MSTSKKVFISSPCALGDTPRNVRRQHEAFRALLDLGHIPFAPSFSHYHELIYPTDFQTWMKWDFRWIESCDYVLRLPGNSIRADRGVEHARNCGVNVLSEWSHIEPALILSKLKSSIPATVLYGLVNCDC